MTDSHLHLDALDEKEIELGVRNGILLWGTSSDYESALLNLKYKGKYPENIKIFLGIHPENPENFRDCEKVLKLLDERQEEIEGIGEIGIPSFFLERFTSEQIRDAMEILEKFIKKAAQIDKPIIFHIVGKDIYKVLPLLDRYRIKRAMFHWYIGGEKEIHEIEKRGYFISVNIALREDQEYRRYVGTLPLKNILLETDAPYGYEKSTSPMEILGLEEEIGKILGISGARVETILKENEERFLPPSTN